MDFLASLADYAFLRNALFGGLLASAACGLMGPYVVVRRIGYVAGGIAHSVLGGMGLAYFLGGSPIWGALAAALAAAMIIGWVSLRASEQEDTLIGAVWAVGMAVGIMFITQTPGYNADLMSYLFGSILLIPDRDLWLLASLVGLMGLVVALFYKQFLAIAFDPEFARIRGVRVELMYLLLLCLIALTVVVLVQVVGLVLVIALLTLPAALAARFVRSLFAMMVIATILGVIFTTSGLAVSFQRDLPAGATIILIAGSAYFIVSLAGPLTRRIGSR
ncbi:MAG: metal ABC transporter permease [Gammaproteobacteria bacterium]|nr:metal ABC transporter permease [Gammaproteobacteria bacterium]